jgi:DNA sulfur modification protein DndE
MNPPVETVRISSRGRDILIKVKRKTGIERWNEICRLALCRSLANPSKPPKNSQVWDSAIEIEWKTFAGELGPDFAALIRLRATNDKIDATKKDLIADYFRAHLERGIASLQNTTGLESYLSFGVDGERI